MTATSDLTNCPRCHRGEHDTSRRLSVLDSADSDQEDGGDSEAEGEGCRGDHSASALEKEEEEVEEGGRMKLCSDMWREVRVKLRGIVDSKYFNRGIMIAILVNTISMGIEHHEQVGCAVWTLGDRRSCLGLRAGQAAAKSATGRD